MNDGVARLATETAQIDAVDGERSLAPGTLSPRQRLHALADAGTILEVGRLARSQQPVAADSTPADGLITAWARVSGRECALLIEDPVVLARTDGQVAANKRHRILTAARNHTVPVIYVADGAAPATFDPMSGRLFGHLARERTTLAPTRAFVAVILGTCSPEVASLLSAADVVIATGDAPVNVDVMASSDASALETAHAVLALAPEALASHGQTTSLVAFRDRPGVQSGLARVEGWPVVFAYGSGTPLVTADLVAIRRAARMSGRWGLPLVFVQDTAGYDEASAATPEFVEQLRGIEDEVAACRAPKICVVTGRGNVIGTFALGGRNLGMDYILAWPSASIAVTADDGRTADDDSGPWLAAGMGLVDDVVSAEETTARVSQIIEIMAPCVSLPTPEEDMNGRVVDEISKV